MLNKLLIWFSLVLGILLMYFSFDIDSKIPNTCKSKTVRDANKGLLILGMLFVATSLAMLGAPLICDCSKLNVGEGPSEVYAGFILLLSIVLIILSSLIKKSNDCYVDSSSPAIVLGIGIIMLLLSAGVLGNSVYQMYGKKSGFAFPKSSCA
tara:strand:+ start:958 stop:1413 length:456 start_codon:yes stop_codon:yes gene_type:complete